MREFETADRIGGRHVAGPAPVAELSDIDAAVAGFAIVDPGLRAMEAFPELPLRQIGFLPQTAQEAGNGCIAGIMLGLGCHGQILTNDRLDTSSMSDNNDGMMRRRTGNGGSLKTI